MFLKAINTYRTFNMIVGINSDNIAYACYYARGSVDMKLTDSYREFWL